MFVFPFYTSRIYSNHSFFFKGDYTAVIRVFLLAEKQPPFSALRLLQEYSRLVNYSLRAKQIAPISSCERNISRMVPFSFVKITRVNHEEFIRLLFLKVKMH